MYQEEAQEGVQRLLGAEHEDGSAGDWVSSWVMGMGQGCPQPGPLEQSPRPCALAHVLSASAG